MKYGKLVLAVLSMLAAPAALAGELDGAPSAPQGIIVRVDQSGLREVYKAAVEAKVQNDQAAAAAAAQFVKAANRVPNILASSELDRTTSSEAWYSWYNPSCYGGYYYSYSYYNYSYNYYPTYRWSWGSYSYYYYTY